MVFKTGGNRLEIVIFEETEPARFYIRTVYRTCIL
uniref:Uncharacterized protein n=1 Tax=Arundo donax TaxID=35708 RepID=A0A0A9GB22_ARUDO